MVTTPNKGYDLQATGSNAGTWGADLNNAVISVIDNNIGGFITVSVSNVNVTLSAAQAQNCIIRLSGVLTADIIVTIPGAAGCYYIDNSTLGNFQIRISSGVGVQAIIPIFSFRTVVADPVVGVRSIGLPMTGSSVPFRGIIGGGNQLHRSMLGEYLIEDGSAVSRTVFPNLFAYLGVFYGAGDGSTTFNLPDSRGRVIVGLDNMGVGIAGRTTLLGGINGAGGEQTHQLVLGELPSHNHGGVTGNDSPDHLHAESANTLVSTGQQAGDAGNARGLTGSIPPANTGGANVRHQHSIPNSGSDVGHNNLQPSVMAFYIIKT